MKRHVDSSVSAQPNRNKYRACRGIRMNLNAAVVQVHSRRRLTGVVISHRPASSRCGVQTYEQRERRTRTGHVRAATNRRKCPVSPDNQRLYLNGARVAQMSDTQPPDLNSNPLGSDGR
jgi:hypothetical protein